MLKYKFKKSNQDSYRLLIGSLAGLENKTVGDESIITDPEVFLSTIEADHAKEEFFTWNITQEDNFIKISVVNDAEPIRKHVIKFDYNMLKEKSCAQSLWCISSTALEEALMNEQTIIIDDVSHTKETPLLDQKDFISMFETTYNSKVSNWQNLTRPYYYSPKFFIPYDNCDIEDLIIVIPKPMSWTEELDELTAASGVDPTKMGDTHVTVVGATNDGEIDSFPSLISGVTLSKSVSGDVITVTVTADPKITTLWLEAELGFLPKSKVTLTNGVGTFKVLTTGLEAGEQVYVKINHRLWTNASTFTHTVA